MVRARVFYGQGYIFSMARLGAARARGILGLG